MNLVKVKSITKLPQKSRVINLAVAGNHTFVSGNGIVTHNCDLASNKILCLQPVLEGNGIFIKKINRKVTPNKGFNIFATANTKGKGSEDGSFIGTNILNEAFLERFAITEEQSYPDESVEIKIIEKVMEKNENLDSHFSLCLVRWADAIRKTFADGGVNDIISTRRLVHIVNAFSIFGKKDKAIELCLNRFDSLTKNSFIDLYKKIDETAAAEAAAKEAEKLAQLEREKNPPVQTAPRENTNEINTTGDSTLCPF